MIRRSSSGVFCAAVCVAALVVPARAAVAQPAIQAPTAPNEPQAPILKLVKDPAIRGGQTGVVKGTVDGEGLRFRLASLSILQPVIVTLVTKSPADHLKLTLYKKDWKTAARTGATGDNGQVEFDFRTEGGVNVLVQSSGPLRPFYLVAWAGDEFHPPMKDVIVTPAQFKGKKKH